MGDTDMTLWQKGDKFLASHLNEPLNYLKSKGAVVGNRSVTGKGILVYSGSRGDSISATLSNITGRWFWGKIIANGPSTPAEADYTDQRYWVTCEYMNPTADNTKVPDFKDDISLFGQTDGNDDPENDSESSPPPVFVPITTAVNIAECRLSTHNIAYGEYVQVYEIMERPADQDPDKATTQQKQSVFRWVFYSPDVGRGQYQGMVLSTVSQNQRGWDFPRAHPMS